MKIDKKLKISTDQFYKQLIRSIQNDILTQTGEEVLEHELEGYSYDKNFPNNQIATMTITEIIHNKIYEYKMVTDKNIIVSRYTISSQEKNTCEVEYEEHVEFEGALQSLNDSFMGSVMMYFKKRRFASMLSNVERTVNKNESNE
ncbi:hypothetical protein BKP56_10735 [Marinilactibacillus sp. 15R]|uniref:DUF3284 domain-containing protein n=1 Tax=Marinilactibacillus piezotolerans TaxID=258723 RepID=A0A1I3YG96_9LACT|nr:MULTISPECIES: DUF3284 domain-containing protein [Marinilactibacillus]API89704.1 hypothetical protein BKP56_10735 [Marinilactibacillus sp. 15R]SFK30987.1 protein of unknown function [Marinilactibacillus piezotolerans]